MRRLAVGTLVAGALIPAGATAANACDGHHGGVAGASYTVRAWHHDMHGGHGVLAVAESYLGLPKETIFSDLKSGQSLADIANATSGKSAAGLVDAYSAALKTKLDKWVAAGKIDTAKESEILADATPWITKLVNAHFTGWHWAFGHRKH
jgi:hypothetical protein